MSDNAGERKSTEAASGGILKAAGMVSGLTLVSRVLGMVRDVISAALLGSGAVWDAFVLAFTIPNLFRRIFGEGALTSALLPVLVKVRKEQGEEAAGRVTSAVTTLVGLLLGVTALIISIGAVIYLGRRGFDPEQALTASFLALIIFYLPFICMSAILAAALNSARHFAVPAFAPVILNIVWVAALAAVLPFDLTMTQRAFVLTGGIVFAGILQFAVQVPVLYRVGYRLRPVWDVRKPEVLQVFRNMGPVIFALLVMQINVLIDQVLAKTMVPGDGAVSALFYGNRLMQLPLAVFGIAVGVAVFPSLREFAVDGERSSMWRVLNLGLRILMFLILPCAAGLIVIGAPLVGLLFNRGAFAASTDAAPRAYFVLVAYSTGLLFFSVNIVLTKVFHSLDNRRFPARVAVCMVGLNLGLNLLFLLLTPMREAGLALSTSITALVNAAILITGLTGRYGFNEAAGLAGAGLRVGAGVLIMTVAAVSIAGFGSFQLIAWPSGTAGLLFRVLAGVAGGAAAYGLFHWLTRSRELRDLITAFRRSR